MWQTWVNIIIGLWLIISGVVISIQGPANFIRYSIVIAGIIVVILSILLSGGKKEEKKKETA